MVSKLDLILNLERNNKNNIIELIIIIIKYGKTIK
jgi:hypothetical protein